MPNSDIAALGKQIHSARKKADLTQEQLSALCHVSTKHIANIEKGIMNPSYEILLAIFRILPVSLDALILPRTTESECELRELSQIYLSCPEPVRKALLDSTRSLAMNLTEFYNKIESP